MAYGIVAATRVWYTIKVGEVGTALGGVSATVVHASLSDQDAEDWGWRVPFLLGVFVAPCAYLFTALEETAPLADSGGGAASEKTQQGGSGKPARSGRVAWA